VLENTLIDLKLLGFLWMYTGERVRQHNRSQKFAEPLIRGAGRARETAKIGEGDGPMGKPKKNSKDAELDRIIEENNDGCLWR
jgi:hypothetical protein